MARDELELALQKQADAAEHGFDWPETALVFDKIEEELGELREALTQGHEQRLDEAGDLLFVIVNLCRHLGVSPTDALAQANRKFDRRFAAVLSGRDQWDQLSGDARLQVMERLWQSAKQLETGNS